MQTIARSIEGVIAVANEGRLVVAGRPLFEAAVIEIANGTELFRIPHEKQCTAAAFSPDSRTLATGTAEGRVSVWHVTTGQFIAQFETDRHRVVTLRFSSDGTRLAAATVDHLDNANPQRTRIYLW
jgi:WD40 repeat protein